MDHLLTPARSQSMRPHWGYVPPSHGLRHALTRGHRADCALSRPRRHRPGDGVCLTDFNVGPRFASGARSDPAPSLATCFTDDRNVLREGIETVVTNGPYSRARLAVRLTAVVFRRPDAPVFTTAYSVGF